LTLIRFGGILHPIKEHEMKYTFKQFIAALEALDFDKIEEWGDIWAEQFLSFIPEILSTEIHNGDCTKVSSPCSYCVLQWYLDEYKQYSSDEETWRIKNEK
jgi:hypothetical protein